MTKNELLNLGFKQYASGHYDDAITTFDQALQIDPDFDLALNAMAEVYNKLGNLDKAIDYAKKLVAVNPEDPIAHTALSRLYVQKGMIREAEEEMAISGKLSVK
jgi:tetratricopeptide (TPR) repeat protein